MGIIVQPIKRIRGEITVSGDKSITHRAYIFSSISNSNVFIKNPNKGADVNHTLSIMQSVGAVAKQLGEGIKIKGIGLKNIREPENVLDAGNSGTTVRLLAGLFAGIENKIFILSGDDSLRKRPMKRVIMPIREMGGETIGRKNNTLLPLVIKGKKLRGIQYKMPVASAQVKSAIILAALSAEGKTEIEEPIKSRNHTEIMLKTFGGQIKTNKKVIIYPVEKLENDEIFVPGDFSSAAYFIALSLITKDAKLLIKNVGLNPTRTYFIKKLKDAGGKIKILNKREKNGEIFGDIYVESSNLKGITVKREEVPYLIDELPLIGVIGAFAEGITEIRGAEELRTKESDRIKLTVQNLRALGIETEEFNDGFKIMRHNIKYGYVKTACDHRITLSFIVFGLASEKGLEIEETNSINISFPEFFDTLKVIKDG